MAGGCLRESIFSREFGKKHNPRQIDEDVNARSAGGHGHASCTRMAGEQQGQLKSPGTGRAPPVAQWRVGLLVKERSRNFPGLLRV